MDLNFNLGKVMIFNCSVGNGHWPQLEGIGLSYTKEVKKQNVCDMEYISNLLIHYIQICLHLNLG